MGLNKSGQVLSVKLNEDAIVSYIALKLDKPRLVRFLCSVTVCHSSLTSSSVQASRFAARNDLPMTHLSRQLDQYIRQGKYLEAVTLIFRTNPYLNPLSIDRNN